MVKYYGRAKERTGSVNTNQPGLKMAGCPSNVGRSGRLDRYVGMRVNCGLKVCGYKRGNKAYRCRYGINYIINSVGNKAIKADCVLVNNNTCVKRAPRSRQTAGGIHTIFSPRL